ncbi:MAG: class I SAM-dependent methyltransferase [Rhodobacteraceae bacterium]|jgi:SAM-dependent methyltransferase|nr:class I SAM-dependent methyltransferase [Alphaproteobacteria bacterium]MBT8474374.1 class I SAM-dependent methyltransferase [Alphaproteobacteria bacterium]NNK66239.1 class I SAM-dependent methyltransferase [Paracoccaceae bacterium]
MAETDTSGDAAHWEAVYGARTETALTWYEAEAALSLDLIKTHAALDAAIIDVGGGASRLVDGLIAAGFDDITVLDLSNAALETSRRRIGEKSGDVTWHAVDIREWQPPRAFDLWHDRAVFHFLTRDADRAAYLHRAQGAIAPGGVAIIMSFALDGPEMCSGLPVQRYSPETLRDEIDRHAPGAFDLIDQRAHTHVTPMGREQRFQVSVFRRR